MFFSDTEPRSLPPCPRPAFSPAIPEPVGIVATTVEHPPVFTVEEARDLRGAIPGAHSKNLFLKDKKDGVIWSSP